ncbi:MAG: 23S rRNA (guanosine(2251)-2'-O)-methyltransferase RlmB [bacterium]
MEILYGRNPVLEALKSGRRQFESLIVSQNSKHKLDEIIRLGQVRRIRLEKLTRDKLTQLAGTPKHQGVVARVSLFPLLGFDEILEIGVSRGNSGLLLLLDGLEDPRNLGAVLRSAEALGVDGVFLTLDRSSRINPTVAKTSAGALEHLSLGAIKNLATSLETIKKAGFWCIGLDSEGEEVCGRFDFPRPTMLIVGGEDSGIRRLVKNHCDALLKIELSGKTSSLNVSTAAAIALYEIHRLRSGQG